MARQNRLVVLDGCYHVTTRIANRQFFLRDPLFRYRIIDWVYGIADFSGVEVIAWCVMENHLHLNLHVPTVPTRLWTTPPSPLPTHSTLPLGTVPTHSNTAMNIWSRQQNASQLRTSAVNALRAGNNAAASYLYQGKAEAQAHITQGKIAKRQGINSLFGSVIQATGQAVQGTASAIKTHQSYGWGFTKIGS